jgi:hypothetical protein
MNVLRGKVVLKEKTSIGIPGLIVVVEAAHAALPVGVNAGPAPTAVGGGAGDGGTPPAVDPGTPPTATIGKRVTGPDGSVEVEYEDAEFQAAGAAPARPFLLLSVLAPAEAGSTLEARTLYSSQDPRPAGLTEEFLIAIPAATLTGAGVPVPPNPSLATEPVQAQAAVETMKQQLEFRAALTGQARTLATQLVEGARASAAETDAAVEASFVTALTGVSPEDAARFNIVPPGTPPDATVWKTVNQTIEQKVNSGSIAGYVVFSPEEAQQFRDAAGHYRTDIPAAEIEPYIFQASDAARPVTITRSDPLEALRRIQAAGDPTAPGASGPGTPAPDGPPATADDVPLTAADLPKFVHRLVAPMVSPEQGADGIAARPDEADVQAAVQGLTLGGGPADVTAYYDFHLFQIAFDYVWQQAIDAGMLDTGKVLCRQLADQGGDPVAALKGTHDPLSALRDEVRFVATAQQSLQSSGVAARLAPDGHGSNGDGTGTAPPSPLANYRPPIVRPSFTGRPPAVDPVAPSAEPGDLLAELTEMLSEPYSFQVFAPGSTNFGLRITYRSCWDPRGHQVGNLAKTLTLAPKETRKVTSKRTVKTDRSVKELEDNQRNRKDETSDTMRDEAEIVRRAQAKTSFSLTAKGSYDIGIADGDMTTAIGRDADASSQETKKQFREALLKSSQEWKDQHKLEVETKVSDETETTDSVELTNPNDELTVTYLFYELQRRFQVSEQIHRLTPVVLVALEVPNPNRDAIDKVLLAHSWIINRVLLDDRYRPALDYLCTRIVGDEMALQDLESNVVQVNQAVEELKNMHRDMQIELQAREAALQAAVGARAGAVSSQDSEGFLSEAWDAVVGSSSTDPQAAQILEDAAKDSYDRAVQAEKDLRMRLDAETAALSAATEAYAKARAEHGNWLLQIAALRAHFKGNVLFYMQAIWSFTFRDQMSFSLTKVKVPKLTAAQKTYDLKVPDHIPLSIAPKPGQVVLEADATIQLNTNLDPAQDFVTLAEIADLDNPLGFKGNYMMFPLRESNPLTDFMMLPFVDSELGLHDPDELGGWTPEDFAAYARQLLAQQKDLLSQSDYAALQSQLRSQYEAIVSNPAVTSDMIIVPTSSLYIEALPGAHPLLENFKLIHRVIDVQKAKAETRKLELENLRYAARLLNTELGDPDFDKQVLVTGASGVDVTDQ